MQPPVMQIPEIDTRTLASLEYQMLEAFDYGFEARLPALPSERGMDMAKLRWLHAAAYSSLKISAFSDGSPEHSEAERVIKFLNAKELPTEASFSSLNMHLTGSQMALWRFGQAAVRNGSWGQNIRKQWEDLLLDQSIHPVIRGFALRHALCWALAENNEIRLAEIKNSSAGDDIPSLFSLFQKAFASLGGPLSPLRLWNSSFSQIENTKPFAQKLWLCPDPNFPPANKTTDWIVPLLEGSVVGNTENPSWRANAEQLLKENGFSGYNVIVAPFKKDLDLLGIALFPALVELDNGGKIMSIKMGDACPRT